MGDNRTSVERPVTPAKSLIGASLHGFFVEKKIGEGGMGEVFVAKHESLSILKVVKILLPAFSQDDQIRARFLREAESVASLDHPNIITIDNFGSLPSGELFLMMPLLTGRPLDEYLHTAGKLGSHHVLQIAAQVASALDHAHARGIVHRDLKPGNIFVERKIGKDVVKLLDFGIAKAKNTIHVAAARTQTGMAIGTPSYMACEQYDNAAQATGAADIFALAVVIVEMLTGQLPWGVHDQQILYFRQKTEAPAFGREIPRPWLPILAAALSPDPARRPPSMRALVVDLASCLEARPPMWPTGAEVIKDAAPDLIKHALHDDSTVRSGKGISAPKPPSTLSASNGAAMGYAPPRRPPLIMLVIMGVLCAGIVGALVSFVTGGHGHDRKATEPTEPRVDPPLPAAAIDAAAAAVTVTSDQADVSSAAAGILIDASVSVDAGVRRAHQDVRVIDAGIAIEPMDASVTRSALRFEVQPESGEMLKTTDSSCGPDAVAFVWKLVRKSPRVEITEGGGIMLTVVGKKWTSNRSSAGESYIIGFFDQENQSVVAFTLHRDSGDAVISIEIARFIRSAADNMTECVDKWRGLARRF